MAKETNKLKNVNVPELFYSHFLADRTMTPNSVLGLLSNTAPSKRGRGHTRVIPEVTEAQWNELYQYAAEARAAMPGAERDTVLRAAICGKALAERMEKAGVANPVTYTPTRTKTKKAAPAPVATATVDALNTVADEATEDEDTSLDSTVLPATPATLDTAEDLDPATEEELEGFGEDLSYGS